MKIFLKFKQIFCKHDMQKVSTRIEETQLVSPKYIIAISEYDIFECTKCGKKEEKHKPRFTPYFKTKYDYEYSGKSKRLH